MENITSLNSPHIERVKALIGSRGKKNRELENAFIAEGIQAVREALNPKLVEGLAVKRVYVTESGMSKLAASLDAAVLEKHEVIMVSDQVMNAMADSESPQGIIALCSTKTLKLQDLWQSKPKKIAFFWQIQDPGNAGTVIRSADAAGFDAVVFSNESVDVFFIVRLRIPNALFLNDRHGLHGIDCLRIGKVPKGDFTKNRFLFYLNFTIRFRPYV